MSFEWKKRVRSVTPYTPGEQPKDTDIIKLNTNENPYPPSQSVLGVLESFDTEIYKKYPDPEAGLLVDAIAECYGVERDMVFVGVGSDDVLGMSFLTFFNSEQPVLFPDITYSFYDVWADLFRIPYRDKKLDDDFKIVKQDYMEENGGIVIANPNAPTGIVMALSDIEEIVAANPSSVVIVDEAYIDFGGESALPLVEKYDNVLVVMTFSKSRAMAGARIGFAIGNKELIAALNACKFSYNSYTMDQMTILLGKAVIEDKEYFDIIRGKIIETREWTVSELKRLGFEVLPSCTNFVFATKPGVNAGELFEALKRKKIFVRHFKKPRIDQYLRITIGTDAQMKILIEALEELC